MKELANPELKQDDKNKKASKKDTKKGKKWINIFLFLYLYIII